MKQTDVKIKSLLTPDCGASVLEEKVDQLIVSFPHAPKNILLKRNKDFGAYLNTGKFLSAKKLFS